MQKQNSAMTIGIALVTFAIAIFVAKWLVINLAWLAPTALVIGIIMIVVGLATPKR